LKTWLGKDFRGLVSHDSIGRRYLDVLVKSGIMEIVPIEYYMFNGKSRKKHTGYRLIRELKKEGDNGQT